MTANEILKKYEGNLVMDSEPNLSEILLEVIKYLDYQESGGDADPLIPQYQNDKLWVEIMDKSLPSPHDCNTISLVQLRIILEKYKILDNEKDEINNLTASG